MRPRCRSASGSVRNSPKHHSANAPRDAHVFCPESTQPPSVSERRARLRMPARSLPASGSDQPWHQISAADAIGGRNRAFCSSVPNSNIVGASRKTPFWLTRSGAWARQYSSSNTSHSRMPTPRPPYSSGHDTTDQRSAASSASQARWASKPSAVSREGSERGAGAWAASQARASARNASWASV